MRLIGTALVAGLLLHAQLARAGEGDEASATGEIDPETYRMAARSGIAAGVTLDILGLLGVMSGAIAVMNGHEAGLTAMIVSGSGIVLGSVISSGAQTSRHRAYLDAGLEPRPNLVFLSWLFTAAAAGFYAGSVVGYVRYMQWEPDESEAEDFGEALGEGIAQGMERAGYLFGMLFYLGFTIHAEGFTAACLRPLWRRELGRSERAAEISLNVHPVVLTAGADPARASVLGVGFSGTF